MKLLSNTGSCATDYSDMCFSEAFLGYTPADCLYIVIAYGRLPANNSDPDLTVISCQTWINQSQVAAEMKYPSLRINSIQPNLSTSHILAPKSNITWSKSGRPGSEDVGYVFPGYQREPLFEGIKDVLETIWPLDYDDPNGDSKPGLVAAVLAQNPALDIEDFSGFTSAKRFGKSLNHIWRITFAQLANQAGRVAYSSGDTSAIPATMSGSITLADRQRLVQNAASTHILSGLLDSIALCILVSIFAMNTKKILPKNPCSIGATAILLAGTDVLDEEVILIGAEWWDVRRSRTNGVFEGFLVSMGWWSKDESTRFGIDIGRARWPE